MRRSVGRVAIYGALLGLATAAVAEAVRPRGGTTVLVDWEEVRRAAHLLPVDEHGGPAARPHRLGHGRGGQTEQGAVNRNPSDRPPHVTTLEKRGGTRFQARCSVDIGPAPVALENDLASLAAEHDLEVPPSDRRRVAPAHRAGCCLVLERSRQGFDLDL